MPTIRVDTNLEVGATPNIRVDLVEELGLEIPTTWDELYEVLKAFKEAYPDSVPWGSRGEYNLVRSYTSCVSSLGADYNLYQDENGEWKLGRLEEDFKEALEFLNKCYEEASWTTSTSSPPPRTGNPAWHPANTSSTLITPPSSTLSTPPCRKPILTPASSPSRTWPIPTVRSAATASPITPSTPSASALT